MAHYFLASEYVRRSKGSQVTLAAAYRAGERIRDERTGAVFSSRRDDVAYKTIVLPDKLATRPDMIWAYDRERLWNAVELNERRHDARLAREVLVALPDELSASQRRHLARGYAADLANRYGAAVDVSIHPPRDDNDMRNHHAHILMTQRIVTPEGLGRRTTLELSYTARRRLGLPPGTSQQEFAWLRKHWADRVNEALEEAGIEDRVSHLSLKSRGIDREPAPRVPRAVRYLEKRSGVPSAAGEAIRAQYRERVEARARGPEEYARVVERQKQAGREYAIAKRRAAGGRVVQRRWGQLGRQERRVVLAGRRRLQRAMENRDPAAVERRRVKRREADRLARQRNPEAFRERGRRYRARHPGARQAYEHAYNRAYKQRCRERDAEYAVCAALQRGLAPTAEESARRWAELRQLTLDAGKPRDRTITGEAERRVLERTHAGQEQEPRPPSRDKDFDYSL